MQGWAWSDLVEARFRLISKAVPADLTDQIAAAFIATAALTVFIVTLRVVFIYMSEKRRRNAVVAYEKLI